MSEEDERYVLDANAFQHVADGWIAAFAQTNGHVVVTMEEYDPLIRQRAPLG